MIEDRHRAPPDGAEAKICLEFKADWEPADKRTAVLVRRFNINIRRADDLSTFVGRRGRCQFGKPDSTTGYQPMIRWKRDDQWGVNGKLPDPAAKRKRRGRPPDTDADEDQRIYDAWKTGRYRTYEELAREFGVKKLEVRRAIDRPFAAHRRRPREGREEARVGQGRRTATSAHQK